MVRAVLSQPPFASKTKTILISSIASYSSASYILVRPSALKHQDVIVKFPSRTVCKQASNLPQVWMYWAGSMISNRHSKNTANHKKKEKMKTQRTYHYFILFPDLWPVFEYPQSSPAKTAYNFWNILRFDKPFIPVDPVKIVEWGELPGSHCAVLVSPCVVSMPKLWRDQLTLVEKSQEFKWLSRLQQRPEATEVQKKTSKVDTCLKCAI